MRKTYDGDRAKNTERQPHNITRAEDVTSSILQPTIPSDRIQSQTSHILPPVLQPIHTLTPAISRSHFSTHQGHTPIDATTFQSSQDLFGSQFSNGTIACNNPYSTDYGDYYNTNKESLVGPAPPNNLQYIPTNCSGILNNTFPRIPADITTIYPTIEHNLSAGTPHPSQSQVRQNNFLYHPTQRPVTS